MKTNKNIIICALLVLTMILCVGAVSAIDSSNETIATADTDDTISDDSASSLNEPITTDSSSNDIKEQKTIKSSKVADTSKDEKLASAASQEIKLGEEDDEVTPEKINNYFNVTGKSGVLRSNVTSSKLTFNGTFEDLTLTINKAIELIGNKALFKNTALNITADNVKVTNIEFIADQTLDTNAVIYSEGINTIIENNNISYDAPSTGDSYAIYLYCADSSKIIGNIINYVGKLNSTNDTKTIAIATKDTNDLNITGNSIGAAIPSLDVGYDAFWNQNVLSSGLLLENANNAIIQNNTVIVNYNENSDTPYNTIYAVKITGNNAKLIENNITLNGHTYSYALTAGGNNLNIKDNNIKTQSDDLGAYGIQIDNYSTGTIENNNITTTSKGITYGIYSEGMDWYNPEAMNTINVKNNTVSANSNTAYGVMLDFTDSIITDNEITTKGNYTTGLGFIYGSANIENNTISATGSNTGTSLDTNPMVPIQTTGLYISSAENVNITTNKITTTGNYTIDLRNSEELSIKDNTLTANNSATGDKTIKNEGSIIEGIVTPETFYDFFEGGVLKYSAINQLIFRGLFESNNENIGVTEIILNRPISVIGDNAILKNICLNIIEDNVTVSKITFIADIQLSGLISSSGSNTIIKNNTLNYNAPNTGDTYAIFLESQDGTQIIGNKINYLGNLNNDADNKTIAIYADQATNLVIKDNKINATLPSVDIYYIPPAYIQKIIYSAGLLLENSENITIENNNITIDYKETKGYSDTISAVQVIGATNAEIIENNIQLNGHKYAYGIYANGKNLNIKDNNIKTQSDDLGAYGIQIDTHSTGNVENNDITAKSEGITYGIYSEGSAWYDSETSNNLTITNNKINVESNTAYGIMTDKTNATITNNNISSKANYTTGIGIIKGNSTINKNNINTNGSNKGTSADEYPMVPIQTTGIATENADITIKNNKITTTGNYSIDAIKTNGTIKDNNLTSALGKGDKTINQTGSNLTVDNNKTSGIPDPTPTPQPPVNPPVNPSTPTVNPSTPNTPAKTATKIVAKKKTFKAKTKVKKYTITLKAGKKLVKSAKVTLKIKGKKYTAKTNNKGKATFKIKKLTKKGKYTATIKYAGNKTYKASNKKVKITIKK